MVGLQSRWTKWGCTVSTVYIPAGNQTLPCNNVKSLIPMVIFLLKRCCRWFSLAMYDSGRVRIRFLGMSEPWWLSTPFMALIVKTEIRGKEVVHCNPEFGARDFQSKPCLYVYTLIARGCFSLFQNRKMIADTPSYRMYHTWSNEHVAPCFNIPWTILILCTLW